LRLAQETNDQLEEMSPQDNRRYVHIFSQNADKIGSGKMYLCHISDELYNFVFGKLTEISAQHNYYKKNFTVPVFCPEVIL
jgi:hypothetical protein